MNKPNVAYCTIIPTNDMGYSKECDRWFVMFNVYISKLQKQYIVYASCEDYIEADDEMKHFAVEFMTYADMNSINMPYDKRLFNEIEAAAKDVFSDLKYEEKTVVGV